MKKILSSIVIMMFLATAAFGLTYSSTDIWSAYDEFDTTDGAVLDQDGNFEVSGNITGGGFSPSGNVAIGGNLSVTGTSAFTGVTTHTGAITASGAALSISTHTTISGALSVSDNDITNVGDIALDSISGDGNAITIGDGADTVTINPTAETTFSDKNITNVGSISLDSITGDANAITIGDGADTVTVNPTTETTFSDKNITNVGDIALDSISSDGTAIVINGSGTDSFSINVASTCFNDKDLRDVGAVYADAVYGENNAIILGDGADTITVNPTTETTFSDKNITNVGDISLDSISGDGNAITIGDGADTVTINPTTETTFSDKNITNVGDISLDTISSDAGTSVGVTLGSDAGDDFNVGSGKLVVEGDSGNVGIGIASPAYLLQTFGGDISFTNNKAGIGYVHQYNTNQVGGIKCLFQQNVAAGSSQIYKQLDGSWYFVNNDTETATGYTVFSTSATERVRITSVGNVGIGDQTPTSKLDVNGTIGIEGIVLDGDGTNYELDISSNINVLGRIKLGEKSAAELRALDPVAIGEIWLNTDTNHIFQSTGTAIGDYVDISDYSTAP